MEEVGLLCSVADVKLRAQTTNNPTSSGSDALTLRLIKSFSHAFEQRTGRKITKVERTSLFSGSNPGGGPSAKIFLPAFPVDPEADLTVFADPKRVFPASTELTENEDYIVDRTEGVITKISSDFFGLGSPVSDIMQYGFSGLLPKPKATFAAGQNTVQVTWNGGLATMRAAAPAAPSLTNHAAGNVKGTQRYCITTVSAAGVESIASFTSGITLPSTGRVVRLAFTVPAGHTVRIYRTSAPNGFYYGFLAETGTSPYDDDLVVVDESVTPPGEGPIEVPFDLSEACVMQVSDWLSRREDPGMIRLSQSGGGVPGGSATFYVGGKSPFLPYVESVIESYRRH